MTFDVRHQPCYDYDENEAVAFVVTVLFIGDLTDRSANQRFSNTDFFNWCKINVRFNIWQFA